MANITLPSRGKGGVLNKKGGNSAPSRKNVPQARTSSDSGLRVPQKGVFGEYDAESLANTGEALTGLSNTIFKVQNKLKKREDDRFLIEYEEGLSKEFGGLVQQWDEAGDLGNPKHLEGLQSKIENINTTLEKGSENLGEDGLTKYNAVKRRYNLDVATSIAKISEARRTGSNFLQP